MKKPVEEKYLHWGWTAFFVVAASITWFFALYRLPFILEILNKAISILNPFIFGFVMAYLLLPIFNRIRKMLLPQFKRLIKDEKRARSSCNLLCSILSVVLFIGLVSALLSAIIPQLYTSIISLGLVSLSLERRQAALQIRTPAESAFSGCQPDPHKMQPVMPLSGYFCRMV